MIVLPPPRWESQGCHPEEMLRLALESPVEVGSDP